MSDRFSKLFSLQPNLYIKGSPVIIEAGALQKDNSNGRILAQLKIRNACADTIIACKVFISAFAIDGTMINTLEYSYLDISTNTGDAFGSKTAIYLTDNSIRRFDVSVIQVVFADMSKWEKPNMSWTPLKLQRSMSEILTHPELQKQYRLEAGNNALYVPDFDMGIFLCTCGAKTLEAIGKCHRCGHTYNELADIVNHGLKDRAKERVSKERQEKLAQERKEAQYAEERRRREEERLYKEKKRNKIILITASSIILVGLLGFFGYRFITWVEIDTKYNKAIEAYKDGDYEASLELFGEVKGYKEADKLLSDSKDKIYKSKINQIKSLLDKGNYKQALEVYKMVSLKKEDSLLFKPYAEQLVKAGDYDTVMALFKNVPGTEQYYKACEIANKVNNIKEGDDLTELYKEAKSVRDIIDLSDVIDSNEYYKAIKEFETGKWKPISKNHYLNISDYSGFENINGKMHHYSFYAIENKEKGSIVSLEEPTKEKYVILKSPTELNWGGLLHMRVQKPY